LEKKKEKKKEALLSSSELEKKGEKGKPKEKDRG